MSLQPQSIPPVPESTAAAAKAAVRGGNRYITMRDELGTFYLDAEFVDLYAKRGQPGIAPWRLALISIFQYVEGLSDEQAAEAVRMRIDWKYALSLELTDPGFDASVLSEFRTRLVEGGRERHLLEAMIEHLNAAGYLKKRGRVRTDSTHVLAAVRSLNRLMLVGETMRYALNVLASCASHWLQAQLDPTTVGNWAERYAARFDDYRLPEGKGAQAELAAQIGADGRTLLTALYGPESPTWLREVPAVETLRQVWLQEYVAVTPTVPMQWRVPAERPPAAQRIASPYDVDARYSAKRTTTWVGYKVHVTESCDDEYPSLITHVLTTPGTTADFDVAAAIQADLAAAERLPSEQLMDGGYVDGGLLAASQSQHQVEIIGPVMPDHSWQARTPGAFDVATFHLDWERKRATCPQGETSVKWSHTHDQRGNPIINLRFPANACRVCPLRQQCTRSATGPRHLTVRPQAHHEALVQRRHEQQTVTFKQRYQKRAGIEGALSQGVRTADLRQVRYRGLAKTRLAHVLTAAALNLRRITDWILDKPRARTRTSPFVKLASTSAYA